MAVVVVVGKLKEQTISFLTEALIDILTVVDVKEMNLNPQRRVHAFSVLLHFHRSVLFSGKISFDKPLVAARDPRLPHELVETQTEVKGINANVASRLFDA